MTEHPPRFLLYFLPFAFSLCLNVLSPVIGDISDFFNLKGTRGLMVIGGLNNLLLFLPMGFFSLLYSFLGKSIRPHPAYLAFASAICFAAIFLSDSLFVFTGAYLGIGMLLGLAVPTFYELARKGLAPGQGFATAVNINIMIGLGLAAGQYASALIGVKGTTQWKYTYLLLAGTSVLAGLLTLVYYQRLRISPEVARNRIKLTDIKAKSILLLSQYLPGSVPWGSLTVFIFPYLEESGGLARSRVILLITLLGVGMVAGSYLAGVLGEKLKNARANLVPTLIMAFFLVDIAYVYFLLEISLTAGFAMLVPLYFLGGILLAVPGSYIKGMLFDLSDGESVQTVFSAENFLESAGKGIGPAVVALLIMAFADMGTALKVSTLFWFVCLVPLFILMIKNRREVR